MGQLLRARALLAALTIAIAGCPNESTNQTHDAMVDTGTADAGCVGATGCACDATHVCNGGLVCDSGTSRCRVPTSCAEAGCAAHQSCEQLGGTFLCTAGQCEPGYSFQSANGSCAAVAGTNCGSGAGSILSACSALNRDCAGSECGACLPGYVSIGTSCRAATNCTEASCGTFFRSCVMGATTAMCGPCIGGYAEQPNGLCVSTAACAQCVTQHRDCNGTGGSTCGACENGYTDDGSGTCVAAATCAQLTCTGPGASCDPNPPHCICTGGSIWDGALQACRAPVTCATGTACPALCVDSTTGGDRTCVTQCPAQTGIDATGKVCGRCAMNISPVCSTASGALTGRVLLSTGSTGSTCECETNPGYFLLAAGGPAVCDADQDGWVTDAAYQRLHSSYAAVRANARCSVRRITDVVLVNDAEQGMAVQSKIVTLDPGTYPGGLELFETTRNDGTSGIIGSIGTGALDPRHVNSLTKACVSASGDYNDNLVEDVDENHRSVAAITDTSLRPLYTAYAGFGYFLETHEGRFATMNVDDPMTPTDESLVGFEVIAERPRIAGAIAARTLPIAWNPPNPNYWQVCRRDTDRLYTSGDITSAVESWTGGDFAEYPNDGLVGGWRGMDHHSEFKCVTVLSQAEYASTTAQNRPQAVYWDGATSTMHRVSSEAAVGDVALTWHASTCSFDGTSDYDIATGAVGTMPFAERSPVLTCGAADLSNLSSHPAVWAIVGYDPRPGLLELYDHGCINECKVDTVTHCPGYTTEFAAGFTCDLNSTLNFGQIRCGCDDNYAGGADCDVACAGDALFTPNLDGIDPESRAGTWICGDFAVSSPQIDVGGTALRFRGEMSRTMVDGTTLTGTISGATVEVRAR